MTFEEYKQKIIDSIEFGELNDFENLIQNEHYNPDFEDNLPLQLICSFNENEMLKALLENTNIDPSCLNNQAYVTSALRGGVELVEILIEDDRVDVFAQNNRAFFFAVLQQDFHMINLMLNHKKYQKLNIESIIFKNNLMSINEQDDIFKYLFSYSILRNDLIIFLDDGNDKNKTLLNQFKKQIINNKVQSF